MLAFFFFPPSSRSAWSPLRPHVKQPPINWKSTRIIRWAGELRGQGERVGSRAGGMDRCVRRVGEDDDDGMMGGGSRDCVGYRGLVVMESQDGGRCTVPVEMKNTTRGKERDVFQQIRLPYSEQTEAFKGQSWLPVSDLTLIRCKMNFYFFFLFSLPFYRTSFSSAHSVSLAGTESETSNQAHKPNKTERQTPRYSVGTKTAVPYLRSIVSPYRTSLLANQPSYELDRWTAG